MLTETIVLFLVAFVGIPIGVETGVCMDPNPNKKGAVCNWKEKTWTKKFDLETRTYYFALDEFDDSDNFIEKKMRKKHHDKIEERYGKRLQKGV